MSPMTPEQRQRYQPRVATIPPGSRERHLAALPHATWDYDEDADEMNVLLPGFQGREGRMVLIGDDLYVSFDTETAAPLSLMIPSYSYWLAQHLDGSPASAAAPAAPPRTVLDQLPDSGAHAVRSAVSASRELAAVT